GGPTGGSPRPRARREAVAPKRPRNPEGMGLRDALFGRKKLSEPRDDRLFALTTAAVTLDVELGLKTAGKAAVVYKPLSSGDFSRVDNDAESLLKAAGRSAGTDAPRKTGHVGS